MNDITFQISNSFVYRQLKEFGQTGKGDARIFLSTVKDDVDEQKYDEFFNNFDSNNQYFLKKDNLINYLKEVKLDYVKYFDKYNGINIHYYNNQMQQIQSGNDLIPIQLEKNMASSNRYYIRLDRNIIIRKIALPSITQGKITKNGNQFFIELFLSTEEEEDPIQYQRSKEFYNYLFFNKKLSKPDSNKFVNLLKESNFVTIAEEIDLQDITKLYSYSDIEEWNGVKQQIEKQLDSKRPNDPANDDLVTALDFYKEYLDFRDDLLEAYNIVFNGAPGTGKSYCINQIVKFYYPNYERENHRDSQYVYRTTLHEEFSYSDFVGQILPKVEGDNVNYEFVPGIFTLALKKAMDNKTKKVFLVLEELSRANVSAVFGDIFQLLDRDRKGNSEYKITQSDIALYLSGRKISQLTQSEIEKISNTKIFIPHNLFIYTTANLSDQNVFAMDTAFKRRFEWKYITTRPERDEETGDYCNNPELVIDGEYINWCEFYQKLNSFITDKLHLPEDKQIGQFFIKFSKPSRNKVLIQNKLLQYLWEDIHKPTSDGEIQLFNQDISSFSQLYDEYENGGQIFSTAFHEL